MVKINLALPIDSTFLSEVMYEGILYLISKYGVSFNSKESVVEDSFLKDCFKNLSPDVYENIKVVLTGNDDINTKIFEKFGLSSVTSKKVLYDLYRKLQENSTYFNSKNEINLKQELKGSSILFDVDDKKDGLSLQLLKLDRYTGLTTTDLHYSSKKLTSYFSKELILISLIGIYSSYITSIITMTSKGRMSTHYFLFFAPDEILSLLSRKERAFISKVIKVKDEIKSLVKDVISFSQFNEILLLELTLNTKIHESLENENLDKISTLMFKICPEGQTYKIYEVVPITLFKDALFNYKVKEYFKGRHEIFLEAVQNFLHNENVRRALSSLNSRKKMDEADNILSAIQNLYKFITFGDIQGYLTFTRNIFVAHDKTKNEQGSSPYLPLLVRFPY
ncbi:MAG: hypothetical protein NC827_07975 [Candidatus Omnitrophica bacterium]|nr:hypothetical protein [Candidatus Omnitrophota bacterium]